MRCCLFYINVAQSGSFFAHLYNFIFIINQDTVQPFSTLMMLISYFQESEW